MQIHYDNEILSVGILLFQESFSLKYSNTFPKPYQGKGILSLKLGIYLRIQLIAHISEIASQDYHSATRALKQKLIEILNKSGNGVFVELSDSTYHDILNHFGIPPASYMRKAYQNYRSMLLKDLDPVSCMMKFMNQLEEICKQARNAKAKNGGAGMEETKSTTIPVDKIIVEDDSNNSTIPQTNITDATSLLERVKELSSTEYPDFIDPDDFIETSFE